MKIDQEGRLNFYKAANSCKAESQSRRVAMWTILIAMTAFVQFNPVFARDPNGYVISHTIGFFVERNAWPKPMEDGSLNPDILPYNETLAFETTLWGYRGAQPDVVCTGVVIEGDSVKRPHPACTSSGSENADAQNLKLKLTTTPHYSGVTNSVDISAQITNMDENLFRVSGMYRTSVEVDTTYHHYQRHAVAGVKWGMLITIKQPMKVIVSNCESFDLRFLPVQYLRDEGDGRSTCAFEIRDVNKYNVAGPNPKVAGSAHAPRMTEDEFRASLGKEMTDEEWAKFETMLAAMDQDIGDLLGDTEQPSQTPGKPEPSPEILRAAESRPLSPEEIQRKLQAYPPLDDEWIPPDYVDHQIGAHQHEEYEKRRTGDPEALEQQREFLERLENFNDTISGRQLMFMLNELNTIEVGHQWIAEVKNPGDKAEKWERFTISLYPITE